jgi:hypothetical protein
MKSHRIIARTFGIFFLLAFLSYGLGTGLTASITEAADSFAKVNTNKVPLVLGVILMAMIHTIVSIGSPLLMLPILRPFSKVLSYGYLSAGIAATIILIMGSIFLMLYIPLGSMYASAESSQLVHFETIGILLTKGNYYAYQIGMAIWGLGGLLFCYLLYISHLVPRGLSVWGFLGYIVFISGTILELFGYPIGVQLAMPGGLFEITLSIWLIARGFKESQLIMN